MESNGKQLFLVCEKVLSDAKEYNKKSHYDTLHKHKYEKKEPKKCFAESEKVHRSNKSVRCSSLLGAQHLRDSVENKPASLLVVSLGKALKGTPPSLCGRQMVGPSSLPVVVAQSDERHANRA